MLHSWSSIRRPLTSMNRLGCGGGGVGLQALFSEVLHVPPRPLLLHPVLSLAKRFSPPTTPGGVTSLSLDMPFPHRSQSCLGVRGAVGRIAQVWVARKQGALCCDGGAAQGPGCPGVFSLARRKAGSWLWGMEQAPPHVSAACHPSTSALQCASLPLGLSVGPPPPTVLGASGGLQTPGFSPVAALPHTHNALVLAQSHTASQLPSPWG